MTRGIIACGIPTPHHLLAGNPALKANATPRGALRDGRTPGSNAPMQPVRHRGMAGITATIGATMFADYHVHTEFSDDSVFPLNDVCALAIERGIDEICITDHVDYGVRPDWDEYRRDPSCAKMFEGKPSINVDYERYFPAIAGARERFAPELTVKTGMEFGVQSHTIDRFRALFDRHAAEWDFIILSIHQVGDKEFWDGTFQEGKTQEEYNMQHYEEMLRVVQGFDNWSVIGHVDHIKRYDPLGPWPDANIRDIVAAIFKEAIRRGKGIELNTSSVRYGLSDLTPSTEILRLYRDLGGRILTLGSDSHKPEHLGAHIPVMRERLRALGFDEFCTFDHMEPVFHKL